MVIKLSSNGVPDKNLTYTLMQASLQSVAGLDKILCVLSQL